MTSVFYAFTGASACIQLKKFDEASAWCDKGLAVSFTALNLVVWLVFLGGSPKCDPRCRSKTHQLPVPFQRDSLVGWLAKIIEHFLNIVKNDIIYACIPSRLNLKQRLLFSVPALLRSDTDFIGCTDCTKWVPAVLRLQAL